MIFDSSVIMAMLLREPGAEAFEELIAHSMEFRDKRSMSAASVLECSIVARKRLGESGRRELDTLIGLMKIQIRTFNLDQLKWARFALETYGRGQHPAKLNFGDCFSYALAKSSGEPILFKGTDFSLTDLATA